MFFFLILLCFSKKWEIIMFNYMFSVPMFMFLSFSLTSLSKNSIFFLDCYSFLMVLLTVWIIFLSIFSSFSIFFMSNFFMFLLMFMILNLFLFFSFLTSNFLIFFVSFESTLLPTIVIIVGWGYKIERLKSGLYMFFYTLIGSLPMIISIIFLYKKNGLLDFGLMDMEFMNNLFYFFSIMAFLIKMPMFLVHSWLPKAHVEAPVSGSMILAGVLLKLGGYGIFRLMFLYKYFLTFNLLWIYLSIWGGILSCFIAIRQYDMKSLVAYSSVSHMSLVILSFLTNLNLSISSCFILMFSHGLCSSALFYLVNLVYERSHNRSLFINKGLMNIFPNLSLWWFVFCSMNMAAPPSLNLFSEILIINLFSSWSFNMIFFFMFMSFLSAVYSLFLFSFSNHGFLNSNLFFFNLCLVREYMILFLHSVPLIFFFLKFEMFI
uniref:NADH-ubiquinone oxidoreductase chain 4 n=1 Tax=Dendrothrips minowai TaxID=1030662 RepID=A0A343WRP1_9NEOP|nr:NADH dehydrogenase subunit 4 [Dendrothrips minowai]AWD37110.1 NADH dehydrogenase subunit 4 [Dendrothrips minowai]